MNESEAVGFPQFAPLATPFVKTLLAHQEAPVQNAMTGALGVQEQIELFSRQLQHIWGRFEQRVSEKRQRTYDLMSSVVQVDFSTGEQYVLPGWIRETFSTLAPTTIRGKKKDTITPQTLSVWNEKHILRHYAWGRFEAQTVAGVLVARQLDETRERFWLPSVVDATEPYWWCYSQSPPVNGVPSPIVPCPIPLPPNLHPSTLLWTPWAGASWDPRWLQIGYMGAIRWAGATLDKHRRIQWAVSEADLKRWDPEIVSFDMGFLKHTREAMNGLSQLALLRLAVTRLQQASDN